MNKSSLGKIGEDIACGYLVNKGYQIIQRNYREKIGEIDIIAKSPDKILVFLEVKTLFRLITTVNKSPASYSHLAGLKFNYFENFDDSLMPEDNMSRSKINKFKRICQWYANNNPSLVKDNGFRLDVLAIELDLDKKVALIRHYKNI